jgi:hypothetical protein
MADENKLVAYQLREPVGMELEPAAIDRDWMNAAPQRFPYRCLPMVIANQAGWVLTNPTDFRCYWYEGERPADLEVRFDGHPDNRVTSHFGSGVLTFTLPYLFRTPPGMNLWVKGPTNWPKDGIQALEGIVETDWSPATFTMNWRVTRPYHWIEFKRGEPICMVLPYPRGLLEDIQPERIRIEDNPELHQQYLDWEKSRTQFLVNLSTGERETVKRGWQKDYFQGKGRQGEQFREHQTRLQLKEFPPPPPAPPQS